MSRPISGTLGLLLALFVLTANEKTNAQQFFNVLASGNIAGGKVDSMLLNEWRQLSAKNTASAFLFTGNLYDANEEKFPAGLYDGFNIPLLLAPGRSEWDNGRHDGKDRVRKATSLLEKQYTGEVFFPQPACPGPHEVVLSDYLVVILLDTYWWVHKHDRRYRKCNIESDADVLILIQDAIRRHYPTKHVVIAGHQSLEGYGNSGGHFSWKQWILQAPYTLYRETLGLRTDHNHPEFKAFRDAMFSILQHYPDVIYLSSGDENLQYFEDKHVHHLISGSMVQQSYVKPDAPAFGSSRKGFARLQFSSTGKALLEFYGNNGLLYTKQLYYRNLSPAGHDVVNRKLPDSTTVKAGNQYNVPPARYFWLGKNYRQVWNTAIKAPVFDISTERGGLTVVKRGGGQQTRSLRLQDAEGREYVLRSIEKYVEGAMPAEFKQTFAMDLVQDQISASNPYSAPVVARLAQYAGVFHTNPEIVFVPDDPLFGIYRPDVANQLFLFEERPDGKHKDLDSFGTSKKIISTGNVMENLLHDKTNQIDKEAVIRARLFDIWINDWDRHADQWRWAAFKDKNKVIYKPIPRDRDQAFFVNQGFIPWLAARKWLMPKIQGFDEFTENVTGLAYNARYFDRFFLTQSNWNDWLKEIDSLKVKLDTTKINSAVMAFPTEVQPLCAKQTAGILEARLTNLQPMARQLYLNLAREVDITGTTQNDTFWINVLSDTALQVIRTDGTGKNNIADTLYNRIFLASETRKIRIYGLNGNDQFSFSGKHNNKIDVTIVGGQGDNEIKYEGHRTPGFITIYDKKETKLPDALWPRLKSRYNQGALEYDPEAYKMDVILPGLFTGYNRDDGMFLGGGPIINKYSRYRRQEYKILGNYAFLTQSANFHLSGNFFYPLKRLEIDLIADIKAPRYVNNYFGMGNESTWESDGSQIEYHLVRMTQYFVTAQFNKQIFKGDAHKMGMGLFYKSTNVEETAGRFITDIPGNGLIGEDLKTHEYAGLSFMYRINTLNNRELKTEEEFVGSHTFPTRGIKLEAGFSHFIGLNDIADDFSKASADFITYLSFAQRPRVVYAFRVGGEKIFGDYVFHEAAKLGQKSNLRGYRQTRFYGDASIYQNTEIRIRLKQFNTYVMNGSTGLTLFNDVGRVWWEGENSSRWHQGYGLGFWLSLFDMAVLNISYARSKEDDLLYITLKYQF